MANPRRGTKARQVRVPFHVSCAILPLMPRDARRAPAGRTFHVLNRGVRRRTPFAGDGDPAAVERCLAYALAAVPGPDLLACCLMPNHWHLRVRPGTEDALGRFVHRPTMTHPRRRQGHPRAVGEGHRYPGRFTRATPSRTTATA